MINTPPVFAYFTQQVLLMGETSQLRQGLSWKAPLQWALRDRADRFLLSHLVWELSGSFSEKINGCDQGLSTWSMIHTCAMIRKVFIDFTYRFRGDGGILRNFWHAPRLLHRRNMRRSTSCSSLTAGTNLNHWFTEFPHILPDTHMQHLTLGQGQARSKWSMASSGFTFRICTKHAQKKLNKPSNIFRLNFKVFLDFGLTCLSWFHQICCKWLDKPYPFRLGQEHNWRRSWTLPGTAGWTCHKNLQELFSNDESPWLIVRSHLISIKYSPYLFMDYLHLCLTIPISHG